MKLEAFLKERNLDDADFAHLVGCDRSTVSRIRRGETFPKPALMARIALETEGLVRPDDYFATLPKSEAA